MVCPISLIILTYNEEVNIGRTLESTKDWAGEILIIDSFSTDGTLDICRKYTDKIYQHRFENHGKQFNWALEHVSMRYDWILRLDADEMMTPELGQELADRLPILPAEIAGVYLRRRVYFMDR